MAPGHIVSGINVSRLSFQGLINRFRKVCNKCGLYEKAHKRSRPLNDRGEFVRPGKDPSPKTTTPITPVGSKSKSRSRSASDTAPIDGTNMRCPDAEENGETIKDENHL